MKCLLLPALLCLTIRLGAEDGISPEKGQQIMTALQAEDYGQVIQLTAEPVPEGRWRQVRATALQRRGESRFFEAKIKESIEDFDAFIALYPEQDPYHWQRGLSYYYAEEYQKGKEQFERHQNVNSQDVENAAWHFLCVVRAPGGDVEAARKAFIPIEQDGRVPMKEVHDLFGGRGSEEAVLAAAAPDDDGSLSERERNHLCYAHLYLGLYYEAIGDQAKSDDHLRLAAFEYSMDHYMGRTAQVHAALRGLKKP
jgi:lipoprotein NlpI